MVTSDLKTHSRPPVRRHGKGDADDAERERRFLADFPSDRACLEHLLRLQFGTQVKCPKCARTAKFHKIRQIPAYACQWCGYHLHPMAQTRFARSRIGLRVWFRAVYMFSRSHSGISARELQRRLGLTYKTAWRMRSTIIDAKFELSEHWKNDGQVAFEDLLAALVTPKSSGRSKPPSKR